jgi:hypothetical protein
MGIKKLNIFERRGGGQKEKNNFEGNFRSFASKVN